MVPVVIYTRLACSFCTRAKALLTAKNVAFEEICVSKNPDKRPVMIERAGGATTLPQIFIGGTHVGGCDELHALEAAGKLDELLDGVSA